MYRTTKYNKLFVLLSMDKDNNNLIHVAKQSILIYYISKQMFTCYRYDS